MRLIDRIYTAHPEFGVPRMTRWLCEHYGVRVNHKRVARLMRLMGLMALVPGPHTSHGHPEHRVYPYLLRGRTIGMPNEVWCSDITYLPLGAGYLYLVAIMDWFSRYVLSWELSHSLETTFCLHALEAALRRGSPAIFNTDQGRQFTSTAFTERLTARHVQISMSGQGRYRDNILVERLWRTVKYEHLYLHEYTTRDELEQGLAAFFRYYNTERIHQALAWQTPLTVFRSRPRL